MISFLQTNEEHIPYNEETSHRLQPNIVSNQKHYPEIEMPAFLYSYLLSPYHCIPNKLRISVPIPLKQSLRILY